MSGVALFARVTDLVFEALDILGSFGIDAVGLSSIGGFLFCVVRAGGFWILVDCLGYLTYAVWGLLTAFDFVWCFDCWAGG